MATKTRVCLLKAGLRVGGFPSLVGALDGGTFLIGCPTTFQDKPESMLDRLLGSWSLLIDLQTLEISLRSEEESYSANRSRCTWHSVSRTVSSPVGGHTCRCE